MKIESLFESKFIKVFDLQYKEGQHYYNATRRDRNDLVAVKSKEDFQQMLPDAVSCIVLIETPAEGARLLLSYEYRYPTGQFLLSVPAGLLDVRDRKEEQPIFHAAWRELSEETGLIQTDRDNMVVVNPLLFSTPGMTDESNALVCAHFYREDILELNQTGAEGSECFDGFELLTMEQARKILQEGRDKNGVFYSVYTWAALMFFVAGLWK